MKSNPRGRILARFLAGTTRYETTTKKKMCFCVSKIPLDPNQKSSNCGKLFACEKGLEGGGEVMDDIGGILQLERQQKIAN
jgi:hypothetical protein